MKHLSTVSIIAIIFIFAGAGVVMADGACCLNGGMICFLETTEDDCVNGVGGTWMGEGSDCGTYDEQTGWSNCDFVPPTGACCANEGIDCFDTFSRWGYPDYNNVIMENVER